MTFNHCPICRVKIDLDQSSEDGEEDFMGEEEYELNRAEARLHGLLGRMNIQQLLTD